MFMHIQILIISELKYQEMSNLCFNPCYWEKCVYVSLTKMNNVSTEKSLYISHFRTVSLHFTFLIMFAYQNSWKKYVFTGQHLARIDYCRVFVYDPWKLLEVNEHIVFLLITPLYQYSLLNKPSQWQFSLTDWNGEFSYLILFARNNCASR